MTYTGRTVPGGPALVRELAGLVITKLSVGPMDNNVYLLRCRSTGSQVLIDAAADAARLKSLVGSGGLRSIVTTHRHRDHHAALAELAAWSGAETIAHPDDAPFLPVPTTNPVSDAAVVVVGHQSLLVRHLPGHTPGGIALIYDDPDGAPHVFTGDSLFPGGVGATTTAADFTRLLDAVEEQLFAALPDQTWVYPGHGHDTTLGVERPALLSWRARGW